MKSILALFLTMVWSLDAATYWISPTGNNTTGDGSSNNPWATPRKLTTSMARGDVGYMRGGTYHDDGFVWTEFKSGSVGGTPTIVSAYPGETVIYYPTNTQAHGIQIAALTNIIISGIEIRGTNLTSDCIKLTGSSAMSERITLTNCVFRDCRTGHGVLISPFASEAEVTSHLIVDCQIFGNGYGATGVESPLHQIYDQTTSNVVRRCRIGGVASLAPGYAIHCYGNGIGGCLYEGNFITNAQDTAIGVVGASSQDITIRNNVIIGKGDGTGYAIYILKTTNALVNNNTVHTNGVGIVIERSTRCVVANNIISQSGAVAFQGGIYATLSTNCGFLNNLATGNHNSDFRTASCSTITNTANLFRIENIEGTKTTNSTIYTYNFLSYPTRDFSLVPGSSAINAGTALIATDFFGRTRILPYDIGAIEFFSGNPAVLGFSKTKYKSR